MATSINANNGACTTTTTSLHPTDVKNQRNSSKHFSQQLHRGLIVWVRQASQVGGDEYLKMRSKETSSRDHPAILLSKTGDYVVFMSITSKDGSLPRVMIEDPRHAIKALDRQKTTKHPAKSSDAPANISRRDYQTVTTSSALRRPSYALTTTVQVAHIADIGMYTSGNHQQVEVHLHHVDALRETPAFELAVSKARDLARRASVRKTASAVVHDYCIGSPPSDSDQSSESDMNGSDSGSSSNEGGGGEVPQAINCDIPEEVQGCPEADSGEESEESKQALSENISTDAAVGGGIQQDAAVLTAPTEETNEQLGTCT